MSGILIAEDEEALLEVFAELVEALGYRAIRAHNGEQALMLARTEPPDLVVSDHMMPRRTGVELLRAMRAEPSLASVPFVLLSAARPSGREEADVFLAKPVDLNDFEEAITNALRARPPVAIPTLGEPKASGDARRGPVLAREEVLNWVAHELKTPLSSARLNAQVLLRKLMKRGSEDEVRSTEAVLRQLDRMSHLISSILDASRLAEGKLELKSRQDDIVAFLRELIQEWRELEPQVEFVLVGAEAPVLLPFDGERVRQVLNNLLSNAVKYGGEARRVELGLSLHPGLADIHVRDWGIGISAGALPSVFERFQRADAEPAQGHGLGLYIASSLAKLHGGSLSVKSALGAGSTFHLRLPLSRRSVS
ncbi:hybrid sensor histidine kinase/response regulator [Corallococcus macrosporus]|uniref:histidine kinase n=1 Tax=Corallococcus macrosporus DSM 14697 TaxID=1189310 RepID=A0A250JTY5_9BACT|nr:hybrid sensor histidine kinase/response regulator [Corallococcus macrosporus]ATB47324.1 hybrid sensor histidine kinase/response regulator [Corallococcus macrosporus DSM 14697]